MAKADVQKREATIPHVDDGRKIDINFEQTV